MKRRFRTFHVAGMALLVSILTGSGVVAQSKQDKAASGKPAEKATTDKEADKDAGLEIVELSGKLQMIFANQAKIETKDGKETVVALGHDTTFKYTGTAEPTILSPGLMIRFTAAFDQLGNPQAPLAELEVFRPAKVKRMSRELMQSQTIGVYPTKEKGNVSKEKGAKDNQSTAPLAGIQDYQVVARLTGMQADRIQIMAGGRPMMLQVDPALKITVSSGDPFFCQAGDDVKLTGLKNPAGLIAVETIEVTGAKPLGALDDKHAGKAARENTKAKSTKGKATSQGSSNKK